MCQGRVQQREMRRHEECHLHVKSWTPETWKRGYPRDFSMSYQECFMEHPLLTLSHFSPTKTRIQGIASVTDALDLITNWIIQYQNTLHLFFFYEVKVMRKQEMGKDQENCSAFPIAKCIIPLTMDAGFQGAIIAHCLKMWINDLNKMTHNLFNLSNSELKWRRGIFTKFQNSARYK